MQYILEITRKAYDRPKSRIQRIAYECEQPDRETVATALTKINSRWADYAPDDSGPIVWECSCMQKKCGACAMVIDGRPQLACNFYLSAHKKKGPITIGPLKKFPVIEDLRVDRSILRENLKVMKAWLREAEEGSGRAAALAGKTGRKEQALTDLLYESSRCLQCGCCLEICPNYAPGDTFYGMAGMVPSARLISALGKEEARELRKAYVEHIYEGCGKSLACRDICPAGIDMEHLLSTMNRKAVWKLG